MRKCILQNGQGLGAKKWPSIFVCVLLLMLGACTDPYKKYDFTPKLLLSLKENGDWVRLSALQSGNWEKVCYQEPGSLSTHIDYEDLKKSFLVSGRLITPNGIFSATERYGVLKFFYPPNRVDLYVIDSTIERMEYDWLDGDGSGCRSREDAVLIKTTSLNEKQPFVVLSDDIGLRNRNLTKRGQNE